MSGTTDHDDRTDDGSRDALRAAGAAYGDAYQAGNRDLLERVLADDYVFIALDGKALTKAEAITRWTDPSRGAATFADTESHIRVYDRCAVVTGRQTESGSAGRKAYTVAYRFTVVWARPKGRWQVVSEHLSAVESPRDTNADILGPRFAIVSKDGALALRELGLPAGAAVLDVGTGSGNFAIYLALEGYRVVTGEPHTDTSRYANQDWAARADQAGVRDRIRFESFDASRMPFAAGSFDAVFFFGVLHHVTERARSDVLREALRVVKADGSVVFFEPRQEMLEKLWVDDPDHPPAANPSDYISDRTVRQRRIEGSYMDIFIYSRSAA